MQSLDFEDAINQIESNFETMYQAKPIQSVAMEVENSKSDDFFSVHDLDDSLQDEDEDKDKIYTDLSPFNFKDLKKPLGDSLCPPL